MIKGIHHVQIACPPGSEDKMRAFYGSVLGLPEIPKPPLLAVRGGCWFQVGPQELHCGAEAAFVPARKAHPCILVEDLETYADAVRAAGYDVAYDESIPGVLRFHSTDPVGNRLEIQQG